MPELFKELSSNHYLTIGGGFSTLCGSLSYMLKVQEGKPFKWSEFFIHTLASGTFGLMAYELLSYEGFTPEFSAIMCGMAGWMGTRVAHIGEILVRRKLNITKEEMKG